MERSGAQIRGVPQTRGYRTLLDRAPDWHCRARRCCKEARPWPWGSHIVEETDGQWQLRGYIPTAYQDLILRSWRVAMRAFGITVASQ